MNQNPQDDDFPRYWKELSELSGTRSPRDPREEFPSPADISLDRRSFLSWAGASVALASLNACSRIPIEKIVPYVTAPERRIPGIPSYFATAISLGGYATGVLVESHEGRPTKIEGNPDHPGSLGATDPILQASIASLYDPDRSKTVLRKGWLSSWQEFYSSLSSQRQLWMKSQGKGLRILTGTLSSPTFENQMASLLQFYPFAQWHSYDPIHRDNASSGSIQAFGTDLETIYHFRNASVVLSFDSDFLLTEPGHIRYANDFSEARRIRTSKKEMNRLYVVESTPSTTGAMADHRLNVSPSQIERYAFALAAHLGILSSQTSLSLTESEQKWINAVSRDLLRNSGRSLVLTGWNQPPQVHVLVHLINLHLGSPGKTLDWIRPVTLNSQNQLGSLKKLVNDIQAKQVTSLIVMDCNPAYTAPCDLRFVEHYSSIPFTAHLGLYRDETAALSQWHLPETHALESWSDSRAYDGSISIIQPLIAPLYLGKSSHELLSALSGPSDRTSYQLVRDYWKSSAQARKESSFELFWEKSLHLGIIPGTAAPKETPRLVSELPRKLSETRPPVSSPSELELTFRPDAYLWDGRFANTAWLQELFRPLSKLSWDNAALVGAHFAKANHLKNEDVVELTFQGRKLECPVWILPGHPDTAVTLSLGYGRQEGGQTAKGKGFNAYSLLTSDAPFFGKGLKVRKTSKTYLLASAHGHASMEGRDLIREASIQAFIQNPKLFPPSEIRPPSLYPDFKSEGYAWGMVIDLNTCIGCNTCVIACQSENNIPSVGKDQVRMGRDMYWIRVDRYYKGSPENPETFFEPVPCMHCEKAPCEVVCPTLATVHDNEGLNEMVYNRCVGTRYCSNNCPYKVRRFNFLFYANYKTEVLKLRRNPDVTVRSRGVMEKCTYCIQRISQARITAEKENRIIREREVIPACAQACPTSTILFGDISNPTHQVSRLRKEPQHFGLLTELGTRPRTTYLAKFKNPNPELGKG